MFSKLALTFYLQAVVDEATESKRLSGKAMDSFCCTNAWKQVHSNGREKKMI